MYRQTGSPKLPSALSDNSLERKSSIESTKNEISYDDRENGVCMIEKNEIEAPPINKEIENTNEPKKNKSDYINHAFVIEMEHADIPLASDNIDSSVARINKNQKTDRKVLEKISTTYAHFKLFIKDHRECIKLIFKFTLFVLYNVYVGYAMYSSTASTWCEGVKFLLVITGIAYFFALYYMIFKKAFLKLILPHSKPIAKVLEKLFTTKYFTHCIWISIWAGVVLFLIIDTSDNRRRLISAFGYVVILFLGFVFSKHRTKIRWRHVLWGTFIQFCLGVLSLRLSFGRNMFECFGNKTKSFLAVTDEGSSFVFSYLVTGAKPVFAFKVLTVVIFFSFFVSILYYYGVMQVLVSKVGWLLQQTVGTTACESMNAAGNIFLGMTEAPLLIRPYLPKMTKSELHAVMTGGFATIAGSVLAAYIDLGINASHLLTASVMAAPAALSFSKLVYPETEESCTMAENIKIEKGTEINALEAASKGASTAVKLVANIAANLIAFIAFVAFLDGLLHWFGSLVNLEYLSFEWILSKVFIPLSLLMGVDWDDKEKVANLIGLKNIVNEFVAYNKLSVYIKHDPLSPRSEAIATFALCGFSNIAAIGIQIGGLSAMAPDRRSDLAEIAVRAMIAGSATCCTTACIAGALLPD